MITTRFRSQTLAFGPNSRLKTPMVPGPQTSCVISTSAFTQMLSPACTRALPAARASIFSVKVMVGYDYRRTDVPATAETGAGSARRGARGLSPADGTEVREMIRFVARGRDESQAKKRRQTRNRAPNCRRTHYHRWYGW